MTGHTRSFARLRFIDGEFLGVLQHYCAGADHTAARRWHQAGGAILPMTVANKPGHRGEHDGSRKKPLRGEMPGRSGVTVVTTLLCFLLAREAAGALAPAFPAPSFGGENIHGKTRAHAARSRSCVNVIASESEAIHLPLRLHGLLRFARNDG
jgi:hypothetical protein